MNKLPNDRCLNRRVVVEESQLSLPLHRLLWLTDGFGADFHEQSRVRRSDAGTLGMVPTVFRLRWTAILERALVGRTTTETAPWHMAELISGSPRVCCRDQIRVIIIDMLLQASSFSHRGDLVGMVLYRACSDRESGSNGHLLVTQRSLVIEIQYL